MNQENQINQNGVLTLKNPNWIDGVALETIAQAARIAEEETRRQKTIKIIHHWFVKMERIRRDGEEVGVIRNWSFRGADTLTPPILSTYAFDESECLDATQLLREYGWEVKPREVKCSFFSWSFTEIDGIEVRAASSRLSISNKEMHHENEIYPNGVPNPSDLNWDDESAFEARSHANQLVAEESRRLKSTKIIHHWLSKLKTIRKDDEEVGVIGDWSFRGADTLTPPILSLYAFDESARLDAIRMLEEYGWEVQPRKLKCSFLLVSFTVIDGIEIRPASGNQCNDKDLHKTDLALFALQTSTLKATQLSNFEK
ncbi:MAG: hypothetical protein C0508_23760 [Cyanobacteria bacterium PR.023]|nr:hypothetical protein [Cyanobacteria bacterium PR.023]